MNKIMLRKNFKERKVPVEMVSNLVLFTSVIAGIIFLLRPKMRKHKKVDLEIFDVIKEYTTENKTKLMTGFTFFGTHKFFIPANLALIFYFLWRKKKWLSIRIAAIAISSLALMFLLKYLFHRKRPDDPLEFARGLSFPSGHAIMSVTFYGLIIYFISESGLSKTLKSLLIIALLFFIQMIGFSRVYLRVHYASDVAVGYITGLLWLLICLHLLQKMEELALQKQALLYKN